MTRPIAPSTSSRFVSNCETGERAKETLNSDATSTIASHILNGASTVAEHVATHVAAVAQSWFGHIVENAFGIKLGFGRPPAQAAPVVQVTRTQSEILAELRAKNALFPPLDGPQLFVKIPLAKSAVLEKTDDDFIHAFVEKHLEPYLCGEITAANENRARPELFTIFLPRFRKVCSLSKLSDEELKKRLLEVYVLEAARGYNLNLDRQVYSIIDGIEIGFFCIALKHALEIDFKGQQFSDEQIRELATDSFSALFATKDTTNIPFRGYFYHREHRD